MNHRTDKRLIVRSVRERFEEKIRITPGCWEWLDHKTIKGYKRMSSSGKHHFAHRISYELYVGIIPDGLIVLHSCDNPGCVNPNHLRTGTHQDNIDDRTNRGRWRGDPRCGEDHGLAKLAEQDIYAIRADGRSGSVIARQFAIDKSYVYQIKNRRAWPHLPSRGDEQVSLDGRIKTKRLSLDQQLLVRSDSRTNIEIAAAFGINHWMVSRIKNAGDGYRHFEGGCE